MLYRNSIGRLVSGWQGFKNCKECNFKFFSKSGSRRFCDNCKSKKELCEECGNKKSIYDTFCGNSCAGKWKQRNYESVRTISKNRLSPQRGISISKATIGNPKFHLRGEKNPNWKGGIYGTERHKLMGQVEYINWRKSVFIRDDFTCQICFQRGGRLQADHIIPYAVRKDLALDLNNGRTLCVKCHKKTPTFGSKAINFKVA